MIKKYRKKGTKEATQEANIEQLGDIADQIAFGTINENPEIFFGGPERLNNFNKFLKDNDFEEVTEENDMQNRMAKDIENWNKIEESMNDTNQTFTGKLEGKLHFGEKVDRALEEVKIKLQDAESISSDTYFGLINATQNLVNAIEEEKQRGGKWVIPHVQLDEINRLLTKKINAEFCDDSIIGKIDRIYNFLKDNQYEEVTEKVEDIAKDYCSRPFIDPKDTDWASLYDVKLPEVGKRYKYKNSSLNKKVSISYVKNKIILDDGSAWDSDEFEMYFEELPEDKDDKGVVGISDKSKSIWKDVSELPEDDVFLCILKLKTGHITIAQYEYDDSDDDAYFIEHCAYFEQGVTFKVKGDIILMEDVEKYCTLTDYINNTEERLNKSERMITALVNTVFPAGKINEEDIDWVNKIEGK